MSRLKIEFREYKALPLVFFMKAGLIIANYSCLLNVFPGEGTGNPLQYSCMGNPMNRRAWRAIVYGSQELDMTQQLNNKNHVLGTVSIASHGLTH